MPAHRSTAEADIAALSWQASGGDLTKVICRALRQRGDCAEADPAIVDSRHRSLP